MHVSEIMKRKSGNVVTVKPNVNLAEAIELLVSNKIGAAPVCKPGGNIIGLLTERDILHGIAAHGTNILEMQVDSVMSDNVYYCTPEDNLKHIMGIMTFKHVRHLLVMVDDKILEIISIGDVVRNRMEESELEVDVLRDYARSH